MSNPFLVKTIIFESGERFPVLIDRDSGTPLFDPTVYCVSGLRARNKATNTIDQALRSIMILLTFLKINQIDLKERILNGVLLNLSEIDQLISLSRESFSLRNISSGEGNLKRNQHKPISSEKVRQINIKSLTQNVCSHTAANRIRVIRDYLKWHVNRHLLRNPGNEYLKQSWLQCSDILNARIPRIRRFNSVGAKEGLPEHQIKRLLEVIDPNFEGNPWKSSDAKKRNNLIVLWFLSLGIRRGELLNIKISDIDSRRNLVTIARRADDKDDVRRKQPLVKTRDRILELSPALLKLTLDYVIHTRNKVKGARRNEFLFVSTRSGDPLSSGAINKIFSEIDSAFPKDFSSLTPHVLRHTWNENFSDQCDASGVDKETEIEARKYAMGWKDGATAASYLRRYIARVTREKSLAMQAKIFQ
jgi:integrase